MQPGKRDSKKEALKQKTAEGEPEVKTPTQESDGRKVSEGRKAMRHATPPGQNQKFMKNDQYFTVCIYTFVLVVCCSVAIKAIISFDQTKAFFMGMFRAIGPFLIAFLIAYILNPFVKTINRLIKKLCPKLKEKPSMVLSILIVYLLGVGMIITILVYVLPQLVQNLADLVKQIPTMYRQLNDLITRLQEHFPAVDFGPIIAMLSDTQSDLTSDLRDIAGNLVPVLYTASVSVVSWMGNFLIALIVSVYMLYGKESLTQMFKIVFYAFVPQEKTESVMEVVTECNQICSKYLISKMTDSFIIGILCAILMTILRLPYVLLISVIVGITNMIPYFGPFIGAVPGLVIIFCISPVQSVIFGIMILCLQQFDGLILGPKLMGSSTGMKPIWIIFAITIGGKFFGVLGMFLGVPVVAMLAYLAERYMRYRLEKKKLSLDALGR